ncbi:MAG TPA: thiamine ABC transporter substrate-binding protein [Anaerolineae bacterium]|jgi:thiamine transport system substrate-binding protein|nr:thiamine ABC transporter substrate-binding protein [Anaerolineae bacterium]
MRKVTLFLVVMLLLVTGCSGDSDTGGSSEGEPAELVLMSHDSFALSESVLALFEAENDAKVTLLPAGDAGSALNQAILAKDDPLADVFFGVDNTFLGRALEADIFEPYKSPALEQVPDEYEQDDSHRLLPVDYGDVCLNYDRAWFDEHGQAPPRSLSDLLTPAYQSLLVVENPATSSPGLAFLLATIDTFGREGDYTYLDFWRELRANDVLITDGWEDAYFGHFSAAGDGDRPLVVSYASSPPAEVVYADPPLDEPPTASITAPGMCFRQIEFIGILKGTERRQLAEAFVDFALGKEFQEDIPLNMFVFPANEQAELPEVFERWAEVTSEPATLSAEEIDENREAWIEAWTITVLR